MKAAFQYSYINAKIRSLKSRLLSPEDYENLLGVAGYNGLAECLKTTSYGIKADQFPSSFEGLIHLFYEDLFDCYRKVIGVLSGERKRLIQHLYRKYELENLKAILRIVCYERAREEKGKLLLPLIKPQSFSPESLLQSKSLEEILGQLRRTCYHDPLKNSIYRFEEERETFPLEMALDLSYYSHLWQIIDSLGRRERGITLSLLGVQMDALNILWIFRFKEMCHFSPEEILNYSLMHGCHISSEIRKKLACSVDQRDMVANLAGTPYRALLSGVDDQKISSAALWRYLVATVRKNWQGFPFQIGTILDYVLLKEIEVKDLISITEARRLNLSREITANHLINLCRHEFDN